MALIEIPNGTAYVLAARQLGVYGQPAGGDGRFVPVGPDGILSRSGAAAALDGSEFSICDSPAGSNQIEQYRASRCGSPDFLVYDQKTGISWAGRRPHDGMTVSVVDGRAIVADGASPIPQASVAVQLWPPLVRDGQNVARNIGSNAQTVHRAGLAVLDDSTLAFVETVATMRGLADAMLAIGARDGGYTDGGGSSALVVPGTVLGHPERRPVPTWLIARQESSGSGWIMLTGAALIGLAGYAAYKSFGPAGRER